MKTTAIIQARMSSTRLPGKILLELAGVPMLVRVVERVRRAQRIDETIVATTDEGADDAVVDLCNARGWRVFRGSRDDVLDRYYQAAAAAKADRVVRITSDCPLIDSEVIDDVVERMADDVDYASNVFPRRTFPRGLDVEAFSLSALTTAWREERDPSGREHVTPFLYRHPERFRIATLESAVPESAAHRWAVDTPEDFELLRRICEQFSDNDFGWREVLALVSRHPDWAELNRHVSQKLV